MDVQPAGMSPASPTSRPVIIANRLMATDPMLQPQESDQPQPDPADRATESTAVPANRHARTIAPLQSGDTAEQQIAPDNQPVVEDKVATTAPHDATVPTANTETSPSEVEPETSDDNSDTTVGVADETVSENPEEVSSQADDTGQDVVDDIDDEDDTAEGTALQERTAEQLRREQLTQLITKRTYALPIYHERRRQTIVIWSVVAVVLVLLTLNILLDIQFIELPIPHTNLLAP